MRNAPGSGKNDTAHGDPNAVIARSSAMSPVIVWFRQDLRLGDNPALRAAAAKRARPSSPCLSWMTRLRANGVGAAPRAGGCIIRWPPWINRSSLKRPPDIAAGHACRIIKALAKETKAQAVVWNRCYEPFALERDRRLADELGKMGAMVKTFNAAMLHEPGRSGTRAASPFRSSRPFWKANAAVDVDKPHPRPAFPLSCRVKSDRLEAGSCCRAAPIGPRTSTGRLAKRRPRRAV